MRLALCQMRVGDDKPDNLRRAYSMLEAAKSDGADMAILPEMFCISYRRRLFASASEVFGEGDSFFMLQNAAKTLGMTIVGGSVPERDADALYNTSMVFAKDGTCIGKYRKAHLFDVDFEGFSFRESDTLTAGDNPPLVFDDGMKCAVEICFDVRFPEWTRKAYLWGADLLCLPAAFAKRTGRAHWELLLRARALDNQMFIAGVAPAASDVSYGHSMLCSPTGEVICDLGEDEKLLVTELPLDELYTMRKSIPIMSARRTDLYDF